MLRQTLAYCKKKSKAIFVGTILLLVAFSTLSALAFHWRILAPGIEYMDLSINRLTPWSHVHVFRIDLTQNKLDLVLAKSFSMPHASADEFARLTSALVTINGGFFDKNFNPLGLRIGNQIEHSPLKRISWWGVFYIKDKKPYISNLRQFLNHQPVEFAVQSGPRLLVNGQIPALKPGHAERSAIGRTTDGRVIILVTDHTPMTTTDLAKLMKSSPLNCTDALNLDGGSSSQLYAHINTFQVNVHGFSNVSDAIIVKPRSTLPTT